MASRAAKETDPFFSAKSQVTKHARIKAAMTYLIVFLYTEVLKAT